jgi:hypothetical protein
MIWVLENTGHHACHLMMHLPADRLSDFRSALAKWVEKESGSELAAGTIDIRPAYNAHGFRKYMLKGIDPLFAALYRIEHIPQGAVQGKRFGYTQNLGPSQCKKHGTKKPYRWPRRGAAAGQGDAHP